MKLILEIRTKDDKWHKHVCNDFPGYGSDFLTLYKDGFKREMIATQAIAEIKQYFKP